MERASADPKVARIVADARLFDKLKQDPGWRRLADIVRSQKERFLAGVSRRLLAGQEVDQREIDFRRGFYAGAEYLISVPENAVEQLEQAAERAYTLSAIEHLISEEESPYA